MKDKLFKIFTGIAGVYHIILGVAGLILPADMFVKVSSLILGFSPNVDNQFQFIVKFSSAYILVFGIMLLLLAANPIKNRALVIPALVLFGIRLINKIVFFSSIASSFEIANSRNIFSIVAILFFFLGILLTMPKKESEIPSES